MRPADALGAVGEGIRESVPCDLVDDVGREALLDVAHEAVPGARPRSHGGRGRRRAARGRAPPSPRGRVLSAVKEVEEVAVVVGVPAPPPRLQAPPAALLLLLRGLLARQRPAHLLDSPLDVDRERLPARAARPAAAAPPPRSLPLRVPALRLVVLLRASVLGVGPVASARASAPRSLPLLLLLLQGGEAVRRA